MANKPEEGKTSEHDNVIWLGAVSKNKMDRFFPKSEFPKAMLVVLFFFFFMLMGWVGFLVGMRVCELGHNEKTHSCAE